MSTHFAGPRLDGPEAADCIEQQAETIKRLTEALELITRYAGSDVLIRDTALLALNPPSQPTPD